MLDLDLCFDNWSEDDLVDQLQSHLAAAAHRPYRYADPDQLEYFERLDREIATIKHKLQLEMEVN